MEYVVVVLGHSFTAIATFQRYLDLIGILKNDVIEGIVTRRSDPSKLKKLIKMFD